MADKALTEPQREIVLDTLRSYLKETYRGGRGGPLVLPTFTMVKRTYPMAEIPRSADTTGRRPEGGHSDPTGNTAIALAEGITVEVPGRLRYPAAAVTDILSTLPAHQFTPLWRVLANGEAAYIVASQTGMGVRTVQRRIEEGLDGICRVIYTDRWQAAAA